MSSEYHRMDPRSRKDFPVKHDVDSAPIYMGGRGVMDKTDELNDAVWDALNDALIGSFIGIFALSLAVFGGLAAWHVGRSPAWALFFVLLGLIGSVVWYRMHQPWRKAMDATIAHRKAMEAETERRGKGWAQS